MDNDLVCRACGSDRLTLLWDCAPISDRLLEDMGISSFSPGQLHQCQHCGLGQRLPCLTEEELKQIYETAPAGAMDYAFHQNAAWSKSEELLLNQFGDEKEISILDIGCNEGNFLAHLPEAWHKLGVEGGKEPSQVASSKGINVIADRLQDVDSQWYHQFDVVTLFDVFEHLLNPLDGIEQAKRLLKSGGLLLISTGDMDAWTWRWFKGRHWYLQTPLHLSFASHKFFRYVEQNHSFRVQDLCYISHQLSPNREVWDDRVKAVYYECWQRGGFWRLLQKIILAIPQYSHLKHSTSVPWTMKLKDHQLTVLQASSKN